jgi:hypothetical protein
MDGIATKRVPRFLSRNNPLLMRALEKLTGESLKYLSGFQATADEEKTRRSGQQKLAGFEPRWG